MSPCLAYVYFTFNPTSNQEQEAKLLNDDGDN